jgi:hypothetical protein
MSYLKIFFGCVSIYILDRYLFIFRWNEILDKYYVEKATLLICNLVPSDNKFY